MTRAPTRLRFEHHHSGLGIGVAAPRISFELGEDAEAGKPSEMSAYELRIDGGRGTETIEVASAEQLLVPWPFPPLRSRERVRIEVRVAQAGSWSPWSAPASVEAGLLEVSDWDARFVSPRVGGGLGDPAPLLRGGFVVAGPVVSARLYTTALGVYEASLNGRRVGDEVLAPGWTSYSKRLCYQTYDVTDLLVEGENTLEALIGNGWYRGNLTWSMRRAVYGERLGYLAQLEIEHGDGSTQRFVTDQSWRATSSGILEDDLYNGQVTDRRVAGDGPSVPVDLLERDLGTLVAPEGPPVRRVDVLAAREILTSPSGRTIVDFGQNLVGWVRLRVDGGAAGQKVTLRHAEVLEDRELGIRPLRKAQATDVYLLSGAGSELLEPTFTFHGFRYAEIEGVDALSLDQVEAVVVASDLERTGWFESSDPDLNRLHENVVWGMRGNFLSIPTDCPQRDERLGWTGDIQVFSPSASYLFDSAGFLSSWLADLEADQLEDGTVPLVVPDVLGSRAPMAAWGDAAVIVPWVLYQRFGDAGILERQWKSMCAWVDRVASQTDEDSLWSGHPQLGDWLDPSAPPDNPAAAKADPDVVATAHLARSAELLSRAAGVLGKSGAAKRYGSLASGVRAAFSDSFVTPAGRVLSDAETVYALALEWSLLGDEQQRAGAARRLADLVRLGGHRIGTGFVGTPLVLDALSEAGYLDTAYRLLFQREVPSWLYAVSMGATTIWERWDSMLPDGSINPGEMTSFNHYALGAVADFLHRSVAGLAPGEPGYRSLVVKPLIGRRLSSARARHRTPYGIAEVAWRRDAGRFELEVRVPSGTTARVFLPGEGEATTVGAGQHHFVAEDPVLPEEALARSATVLDLIGHEGAWTKLLEILGSRPDPVAESAVLRRLGRIPRMQLSELAALPPGPGEGFVAEAVKEALGPVLAQFAS